MDHAERFGFPDTIQDMLGFPQIAHGIFDSGRCGFDIGFNFRREMDEMPAFGAGVLADGRAGDAQYGGDIFLLHTQPFQLLGKVSAQSGNDIVRFYLLREEDFLFINHS